MSVTAQMQITCRVWHRDSLLDLIICVLVGRTVVITTLNPYRTDCMKPYSRSYWVMKLIAGFTPNSFWCFFTWTS